MAIDRETQVLTDAYAAGIRDPKELANFMAQVTHESNGLNRLEESFRYTRNIQQIPVQSAWREGAEPLEAARKEALQGKPEKLAELMYGGRNGNDEPGDGWKYHGRGYIQLTGKDNYAAAGKALDLDLVKHPELAADPQNASKIATWYWENRVPEAARDDVKAATKAVNGKYNGLEDREQRFADWQKRLTPEVMDRLASGQVGQTAPTHTTPPTERTLKDGMDGEDVRKLQADLARLGYKDAHGRDLHTDGKFGPGTKAALESFQRDHKLDADGVAGPKTREAIAAQKHLDNQKIDKAALTNPANPDNAMFEQARKGVHAIDTAMNRTPDQASANLSAAIAAQAKKEGLSKIDHVVLSDDGSKAYAVQGDLNSPLKKMAEVQTAQAVNTPVEQSAAAMAATTRAQPEPAQQQQQQTQQPGR
ncbi:XVIPCD domain-containing protein [Luteibacter aegosomatissinici]|uniref:XVIPCD domain-containing protein n=1 Tax=Luteibacter aegosomatissinici TaxID=2911539 RepID=UPI001FFBE84A|nr:XVIPCD domain-containing protein [Luteibacter aegosomatissinici]UPG95810.1 peptidoglycan-binding protein [Luteibacter aegosomatissinici]